MKILFLAIVVLTSFSGCDSVRGGNDILAAKAAWSRLVEFLPDSGQVGDSESALAQLVFTKRMLSDLQTSPDKNLGVLSYRFHQRPSVYVPCSVMWIGADGERGGSRILVLVDNKGEDVISVPIELGTDGLIRFDIGLVGNSEAKR